MKVCRRCKETKSLSDFTKSKSYKDGLDIYCRSCKSAMKREALEKGGDRIREQKRASHHRHKEKNNERSLSWTRENKDRVNAERRDLYVKDEQYRERAKANALAYPKRNPENFKAIQKRRFEREKAIGGDVPKATKQAIWLEQEERCAYCGITLLFHECEIDHFQPVSRDGTNDIENLRVACESCNASKGHKTYDEWIATRGW